MKNMKIILASASPRRRELLEQIGLHFGIYVSETEERVTTDIPYLVVEKLSAQKAQAAAERLQAEGSLVESLCERVGCGEHFREGEGTGIKGADIGMESVVVIGADTIVACDGQILGKPRDKEEAVFMLKKLRGRSHQVYTGVTLLCGRLAKTFHEVTKVEFYPMTDEEIMEYVETSDPLDKAGAYGIQGFCARYIKGISGDYNNVVGLPVGRLYQELKDLTAELQKKPAGRERYS